jgi:transglutaminase-like putative cysteine protease
MLHHFVEKVSGINFSFFLDENGKVVKEVSPTGFVFISEPEFQAKNIIYKGKELLSAISVPAIGANDSLLTLSSIRYRLTFPEETEFIINQDRQIYNENILIINKESLDQNSIDFCSGILDELSSTLYVQSDNAHIIYQANKIVKNIDNNYEKIRALISWVYENVDKKPILGIPDAVSTLFSRTGDCNEHAALFAALSRSLSIPTRIVAGVTYHKGMFYYHAWNEVCLNEKWISLDTTKNQFPADVTHIKFVQGETNEQMKIGSLIGNLKIEILGESI